MSKVLESRGMGRTVSDVSFGIVLPLFCVVFDPIVFRSSYGQAALGEYSLMGYLAMGAAILSLSCWVLFERCPALFGGLLLGSAFCAVLLGLALLPLTFLGLFTGIGILGLSPFLTGIVFWRNAVEAFAMARQRHGRDLIILPVVGLILTTGIPAGAQWFYGIGSVHGFFFCLGGG